MQHKHVACRLIAFEVLQVAVVNHVDGKLVMIAILVA